MLSFRKKIFVTDFIIFLVFLALLFPLVRISTEKILRLALSNQAVRLVSILKTAPDEAAMVEMMKTNNAFLNQPFSLRDMQGNIIYRAASPLLPTKETAKEIQEAIKYGRGFAQTPTDDPYEDYMFFAIAFESHGKKYIFHTHIIFYEVAQVTSNYEIILTVLISLIMATYIFINQLVLYRFTNPIGQIINAIVPYREGREKYPPRIVLESIKDPEFNKLAYTLNSLTERIERQIESLTRQRQETEEILESIGEGIIATDTSAKVTFVNRAACLMLEINKEQILKQPLDAIKTHSSELSKKCHELILHALQTSEPVVHTLTVRHKGPMYLDLIAAPLAHQNGSLLVLQDKTSDYRIVELGKDFIANASHELRTPITIIRGFAETLQDLPELSQEMLHDITEKIVRTCVRLDKLVRSLLTLSDIENLSQDRFKPADLVLMAENCKHHLLTANPNVQISVKTELESAQVVADADLLELAILNILENAVKYSHAPAQIEMLIEQMGDSVILRINDKGIGISNADLVHIFERFYTVDKARSRKSGGAGLGLSIVKTIIDKHRGKIMVTSELNKGSTFTLILPLHPFK